MKNKILNYSEYLNTKIALDEMLLLMDNDFNFLSEDAIQDVLGKAGLKIHKSKGIIHHLKNATIGLAKLIVASIKGDREQVKELAKSVKREDVLDFLLKLDLATLHLITGPIHFINAVTGWELEVSQQSSPVTNAVGSIKNIIGHLKNSLSSLSNTKRKKYFGLLSKLQTDLKGI